MQSGYSKLAKKKQTGKLLTNYETKTKILKDLSLSPTKSIGKINSLKHGYSYNDVTSM